MSKETFVSFADFKQFAGRERRVYDRRLTLYEQGTLEYPAIDIPVETDMVQGAETSVNAVEAALLDGLDNPTVFLHHMMVGVGLTTPEELSRPLGAPKRREIYTALSMEVGDQTRPIIVDDH